ncbi:TRAP transporter substrate-binding protein [Bradyrhizobium ontarionense]|uniref:TRAP transporter substrate-binding protein n=1 Tax=Bradyrhizobium ontarionense TaxID=2898149 RepID=A0ABY3R612_9BRAD|nr:TRAP transporter substrate-binding protein [Bradyrhizobium sp. A19]UFZ02492.1 TRAP transporter substrate-binding protein [Bradyrhizobium sp. A19]
MSKTIRELGVAVVTVAALLVPHHSAAMPRMISVASGPELFREKLAEGHRFIVDGRSGNALGGEPIILAATRSGALDVAVLTGGVVSSVVSELSVFDIPFLFRDEAHAKTVMQGPIGKQIAAKFADKGLVLLALGKQGFRNLTNSKRPIRSPEDIRGLKIRVIPNETYKMAFKALGAEVIPMDFPLVYGALKDGRLDGEENPLTTISTSRFFEVQKYLTMSGHFFAPVAFVANRAMFEQLDPADQDALMAAAKAGAEATWQAQVDEAKLQELRAAGMEVVDKIDRQAFVDAVKTLDPEFEKRFGKELIAAIRSTR